MLFNSKSFVLFIFLVLPIYHALGRERRAWLLGASFVFYAFAGFSVIPLVCAAIAIGWSFALLADTSATDAGRRAWTGAALVLNFGMLGFFKYANFAARSVTFWADLLGADWTAPVLDLALPVGISFYTFQIASYTLDVGRRKIPAEPSLFDFTSMVMFFPQHVAGPVERASHLLPQIKAPGPLREAVVADALFMILLGFVKKTILADRLADWIAPQFADPVHSPAIAWTSVLLFTANIYVDFSAYSDIAIGLGRLFGFDIRPNFDFPFIVPSIPERWRRWHISMGTWFRDYVYFPLGGNRHGEARAALNVMIVMFLSGLWHGASYNFVVWGLLNGATMVIHRILEKPILMPVASRFEGSSVTRWGYFYFCSAITMCMISSINIFFRADDWEVAKSYVSAMFLSPMRLPGSLAAMHLPDGYGSGFVFFALIALAHELERHLGLRDRVVASRPLWWLICGLMIAAILMFGIKGERFIYYRF